MTAGQRLQQGATLALGGAVVTGPTPDDILLLAGALCLYAASQAALAGSVALPMRPSYGFGGGTAPGVVAGSLVYATTIAEAETLATSWAQSQYRGDTIKLLYRGDSFTSTREIIGTLHGSITPEELLDGRDRNKLWLGSEWTALIMYASTNAILEGEANKNGMMLVFAVSRSVLQGLINTGNVTNRAGNPPPLNGLEFGFDAIAVPSLVGPLIVPL